LRALVTKLLPSTTGSTAFFGHWFFLAVSPKNYHSIFMVSKSATRR
jgi:hypothetical protein